MHNVKTKKDTKIYEDHSMDLTWKVTKFQHCTTAWFDSTRLYLASMISRRSPRKSASALSASSMRTSKSAGIKCFYHAKNFAPWPDSPQHPFALLLQNSLGYNLRRFIHRAKSVGQWTNCPFYILLHRVLTKQRIAKPPKNRTAQRCKDRISWYQRWSIWNLSQAQLSVVDVSPLLQVHSLLALHCLRLHSPKFFIFKHLGKFARYRLHLMEWKENKRNAMKHVKHWEPLGNDPPGPSVNPDKRTARAKPSLC